jgi:hypothetical protein
MMSKLRWADRPWSYEIYRFLAFILFLGLGICIVLAWYSVIGISQEAPQSLKLTELEHTKLLLLQEKAKNASAQAALIRQAYERNQQEGKALQDEQVTLLDQICQAHGLAAHECMLAPTGDSLTKKPGAPVGASTSPAVTDSKSAPKK